MFISPSYLLDFENPYFPLESVGQTFRLAEGEWGINSLGQRLMEVQSQVVKSALTRIQQSIQKRLRGIKDQLKDLNLPDRDRRGNVELIEIILHHVQKAFEDRAENRAEAVRNNIDEDDGMDYKKLTEDLNVARRTNSLYAEFMDNVVNIAPNWLDDKSYQIVKAFIEQHSMGDVQPQLTNAEISLFRKVYRKKVSINLGWAKTEVSELNLWIETWLIKTKCRRSFPG